MNTQSDGRFQRLAALLGAEQQDSLARRRVAVCGVGGVGSYVAEALARSGVGYLTLIDFDTIAPHNINRQLHAMSSTLGQSKVAVMAERIRDINPACHVTALSQRITSENVAVLLDEQDFVADAIDDVPAKLAIIRFCLFSSTPFLCAMGTGNKLDSTKLEIDDISRTSVCPLCRSVRQQLRRVGITEGVPVVYSQEQPLETSRVEDGHRVPASSPWVPAAAGLLMASHIVQTFIQS